MLISIETNLVGAEPVVHLASCSLKNVNEVGNEAGLMVSQVSAKCQLNTRTIGPFESGRWLSSSVQDIRHPN